MPNTTKLAILAACLVCLMPCARAEEPGKIPGAKYLMDATMTTSDGVILVMDIILPPGDGPFPAIIWRNPYNKDIITNGEAPQFVKMGYATVSQDTRGRFKSGGEWDAFRYERQDGFETHEWVGKQPWCNGQAALAGGSYLGFTQCISAPEGSQYVKAMVPEVPWGNTYEDCLYTGGAWHLHLATFWGAVQQLVKVGKPVPDMEKEKLFDKLPLKTWDDCVGERVQYLRDWVAHPTHDDYWKDHEVGDRMKNLNCAALYIGGWYDIFADGVLEYWMSARSMAKTELARSHQYLIIGPWGHGISQDGKVGDLSFGAQSVIPRDQLRNDFLEEFTRSRLTGFSEKQSPLQYYVMGANCWKYSAVWPPARTAYRELRLAASGHANGNAANGKLLFGKPEISDSTSAYVYDPANPVPTKGGALLWHTAGPRDQSDVEAREDVLVYSTPVLSETLEVSGPVRLKLFAASTAKDTDFTAKLVDVHPGTDGKSTPYLITDGILRASFRESKEARTLIEPGKVYEYTIDLGNTSIAFLPGHQIRLEVSSSNFPKYDRNMNTGNVIGEDSSGIPAAQTIFHSEECPSRLILPVSQ